MDYYYLVSQLPDISSADTKSVLPITSEKFQEICCRFVKENEKSIIKNLSLIPPKENTPTGSDFLDKWYENERALRFALSQVRAQKMKKDAQIGAVVISADIVQVARTAVGMDSPLSAEQYLFEYRISVLNNLQPLDNFSLDYVLAYGIRLLLIERMKKFDKVRGTESYHKLYESILDGDR